MSIMKRQSLEDCNKRDDILRPSKRQQEDFNIDTILDIYPEYYILRVNQFNNIAKNSYRKILRLIIYY